jgi:2-amino-4-hydroxy-6-hydroxymethyldihydropteridine diphosphokinase
LKIAYLALGTNIGDRLANLADARARIAASDLHILRESSIYETAPRDVLDQPWFLNQVIEIESDAMPRMLLSKLQKIERAMGRRKIVAKGPRVIDLDIVLFGNFVIDVEGLKIPHPRMNDRRFVLEPLAELAPDLRHPITKKTIREMLAKVSDQAVRKYSGNG